MNEVSGIASDAMMGEEGRIKEEMRREAERKQPPETRAQRRDRERRNEEACKAIESLQGQFLDFFMEAEDPEGNEVVKKMEQIDAKWRVFCKNKNLIPKAYPVMREWMEAQMNEYLKEKEGKNAKAESEAVTAGAE